jgi:uncharacterized protein (TIGR03067 family)
VRYVATAIALASIAFAPLPFPKADPGGEDLKRMQGAWVLVSQTFEGRPHPHEEGRIVFSGHGLAQPDGSARCEVILDAAARPRGMQMVWAGEGVEHLRLHAVYAVRGDTLMLCYYSTVYGRPDDLAGEGKMRFLHVYRRAKP